jgi:hypothetical protein
MELLDFNHENIRMMESINLYGFFFFLVFSSFRLPCSSGRMVLESAGDDFFPVISGWRASEPSGLDAKLPAQ